MELKDLIGMKIWLSVRNLKPSNEEPIVYTAIVTGYEAPFLSFEDKFGKKIFVNTADIIQFRILEDQEVDTHRD